MTKRTPTWYELRIPKNNMYDETISNYIKDVIEEAMSYNELVLFPYKNAIRFLGYYVKLEKIQFDFLNSILKLDGKVANSKDLVINADTRVSISENSSFYSEQAFLIKEKIKHNIKSVILKERHGVKKVDKNKEHKNRRLERYKEYMQSENKLHILHPVTDDVNWIYTDKPLNFDYFGECAIYDFETICSMLINMDGDNCFSDFKRGKMPLKKGFKATIKEYKYCKK